MTRAVARCRCSGGKCRVGGPAAQDPDGALELDPVRVDACLGGCLADQGADGVVDQKVTVVSCRTRSEDCERSTRAGPPWSVARLRFVQRTVAGIGLLCRSFDSQRIAAADVGHLGGSVYVVRWGFCG
jgi:hypothetical protein